MYTCLLSTIVGLGQTNLSQLYFSRLSLAKPAKLNFFKTPTSVGLVSSRTVSTSTGILGCYQPHSQTAMPGQKSIYETFLVATLSGRLCSTGGCQRSRQYGEQYSAQWTTWRDSSPQAADLGSREKKFKHKMTSVERRCSLFFSQVTCTSN